MTPASLRVAVFALSIAAMRVCSASAQHAVAPADAAEAASIPDAASVARIRESLAKTPALVLTTPARFYGVVEQKVPTFADMSRHWNLAVTPTVAPSTAPTFGGSFASIDLLQLLGRARQAHGARELRLLRERIDRELAALADR